MNKGLRGIVMGVVVLALVGGAYFAGTTVKPVELNSQEMNETKAKTIGEQVTGSTTAKLDIETMNQNNGLEPMASTHVQEMNMVNLLTVGSEMNVEIMENVTTGYEWVIEVTGDTGAISYTFDPKSAATEVAPTTSTSDSAAQPLICGAGQLKVLHVEGVKAGTATLTMKLVRPWEKESAPAELMVYHFSVQ